MAIKKEWGNIRASSELIQQAEKLMKSPKYKKMDFTSISVFVSYLIRREIDRY